MPGFPTDILESVADPADLLTAAAGGKVFAGAPLLVGAGVFFFDAPPPISNKRQEKSDEEGGLLHVTRRRRRRRGEAFEQADVALVLIKFVVDDPHRCSCRKKSYTGARNFEFPLSFC